MRASAAPETTFDIRLRPAEAADLDALVDLENRVFDIDRLSRRGFRRLFGSRTAELIVATEGNKFAGYALLLFRPNSSIARLYSIAVAPDAAGKGVGPTLLAAAEEAARKRHCTHLRLEVHERNARAIARYRKSGYDLFGRHLNYYDDHGHALRFEKKIAPDLRGFDAPPYFHQTTEFTCGPACMMMALAWADPAWRPGPAFELKLWREATTVVMAAGPGGCEPYGVAVTLKRHGLLPEVYVSRPGPYFLDTTRTEDKRRVMRLAQAEFQREAGELNIPTHLTPPGESVLMQAFDTGATAIVLVSGYQMIRRGIPHWVFAFGHEGRYVLVHDPAARRNEQGKMLAAETYAVPWPKFERMMRVGPENLRAAVIVRKGARQ
jgi:ribosomal protein S18 acetylase RimI-like enzyme